MKIDILCKTMYNKRVLLIVGKEANMSVKDSSKYNDSKNNKHDYSRDAIVSAIFSALAVVSLVLMRNANSNQLAGLQFICSLCCLVAMSAWFGLLLSVRISRWKMFAVFLAIIVEFLLCISALMRCLVYYHDFASYAMVGIFMLVMVIVTAATISRLK